MNLTRNLRIESIARLQPPAPLVASPQQSVRQAVQLMQEHRMGCVCVCDNERLLGIFTERDLLKRVLGPGRPLSLTLRECMTPDPVTVKASEPVAAALRLMQLGGYRHLPVINENGRPIGILSVKRIVRYLVEHFPSTVYNLPPDPEGIQREREGA